MSLTLFKMNFSNDSFCFLGGIDLESDKRLLQIHILQLRVGKKDELGCVRQ